MNIYQLYLTNGLVHRCVTRYNETQLNELFSNSTKYYCFNLTVAGEEITALKCEVDKIVFE